jgi:hypothetical protein
MTFHEELLQSYLPVCGTGFGKKEDGYDERLAQARLLSELMRSPQGRLFLVAFRAKGLMRRSLPRFLANAPCWEKKTPLSGDAAE